MASSSLSRPVTIRPAYADDDPDLWRLAALDSAPVPSGRLLLAESDGELRAALSLDTQRSIANPFQRNAEVVGLLRQLADDLR